MKPSHFSKDIQEVHYIGIKQLIKNKSSLDRPKDLDDLKYLKKRIDSDEP
jgi:hypothetical protein